MTREEMVQKESEVIAANMRHDQKYGLDYSKMEWRIGYEPASPNLDRVAIWSYHRARDERLFIDRLGVRA